MTECRGPFRQKGEPPSHVGEEKSVTVDSPLVNPGSPFSPLQGRQQDAMRRLEMKLERYETEHSMQMECLHQKLDVLLDSVKVRGKNRLARPNRVMHIIPSGLGSPTSIAGRAPSHRSLKSFYSMDTSESMLTPKGGACRRRLPDPHREDSFSLGHYHSGGSLPLPVTGSMVTERHKSFKRPVNLPRSVNGGTRRTVQGHVTSPEHKCVDHRVASEASNTHTSPAHQTTSGVGDPTQVGSQGSKGQVWFGDQKQSFLSSEGSRSDAAMADLESLQKASSTPQIRIKSALSPRVGGSRNLAGIKEPSSPAVPVSQSPNPLNNLATLPLHTLEVDNNMAGTINGNLSSRRRWNTLWGVEDRERRGSCVALKDPFSKPGYDDRPTAREQGHCGSSKGWASRGEQQGMALETWLRKGVVLPDSKPRLFWDTCWLLLLVIEMLLIGVPLAAQGIYGEPSNYELSIFIVSSAFMMLTILFNFRTAVLTEGWVLVDEDTSQLAAYYTRSPWFAFDMLTCFPIDLIFYPVSLPAFRALNLLRLLKIVRVKLGNSGRLFNRANPLTEDTTYVTTVHTLFTFFVAVHVTSCICLYFLTQDKDAFSGTYLDKRDTAPLWDEYGVSIYWTLVTMTTVGYGDITPASPEARYFATVVVLAGAGGYAMVMGQISTILVSKNAFEQNIREKKRNMAQLMEHFAVPWSVQKEAFAVYPTILEAGLRVQHSQILDDLPPFMKEKVLNYVKLQLVQGVPLFRECPSEVAEVLVDFLTQDIVPPNEYIIEIGDKGREMYLLRHGLVEVLALTEEGLEKPVAHLKDGSWFGEIALLKETERTASVRTVTACEIFKLEKDDFLHLCHMFPDFKHKMDEEMERRLKKEAMQRAGRETPRAPKETSNGPLSDDPDEELRNLDDSTSGGLSRREASPYLSKNEGTYDVDNELPKADSRAHKYVLNGYLEAGSDTDQETKRRGDDERSKGVRSSMPDLVSETDWAAAVHLEGVPQILGAEAEEEDDDQAQPQLESIGPTPDANSLSPKDTMPARKVVTPPQHPMALTTSPKSPSSTRTQPAKVSPVATCQSSTGNISPVSKLNTSIPIALPPEPPQPPPKDYNPDGGSGCAPP